MHLGCEYFYFLTCVICVEECQCVYLPQLGVCISECVLGYLCRQIFLAGSHGEGCVQDFEAFWMVLPGLKGSAWRMGDRQVGGLFWAVPDVDDGFFGCL